MIVDYGKDNNTTISYVTNTSTQEVKQYFAQELTQQGWEIFFTNEDGPKLEKDPAALFMDLYQKAPKRNNKYTLEYFPESNY